MWPWLQFLVAALAILFVSERLSRYADILAEKLGVGRGFIGVVLLGAITSFPELITTLSSVSMVESTDIAMGNILGSNLFNVLIIATMDFFYRELTADRGNLFTAVLALLVGLLVVAGLVFGAEMPALAQLSPISLLVFIFYMLGMRLLYDLDKHMVVGEGGEDGDEKDLQYSEEQVSSVLIGTFLSALVIIGAGVLATYAVDQLAIQHDLNESFAGGLFLAIATSLPELLVCYSAARMGATVMAAGNIFGSNLFNLAILPVADLVTAEPFFERLTTGPHLVMALGGMIISCMAVGGFMLGKQRPTVRGVGIESIGIIATYLFVMWMTFHMQGGL